MADDCGLGKTLQMIALIVAGANNGELTDVKAYSQQQQLQQQQLGSKSKRQGQGDSTPDAAQDAFQQATLSALTASRATLVVCPRSVMQQWEGEIQRYYGPKRASPYPKRDQRASHLADFDVVLTTYSTIMNESGSKGPGKGKGLASLLWKRIVLDEAHVIRNPKTKTTIAVCALEAERRWFVSATPLQNTITDLYSAFLFLRFQPYRTPPSDPATWKSLVQSANGQQGLDRVSTLVASVALRRTKDMTTDDGSSVLGIPAKHVKDTPKAKYLDFSADERRFYRLLRKHSRSSYDRMMSESGGGKMNYSRVLVMLLRLRQASSHYGLITGDDGRRVNWDAPQDVLTRAARAVGLCDPDADLDPAAAAGSEEEQKVAPEADAEADELEKMLSSLAISGSADNTDGVECAVWVECAVCLEPIAALKPMERRTTPCGHTFCRECITQAIVGANEAGEAGSCPSCHTAVTLQSLDVTSNPAPPTPVANSTQHGKKQQVRRIPRKVAPIRRSASAEPEVEAQPKIKRGELERDAPLPDFESPLDRIKSGAKVAYLLQKLRVVKAKDPDEKSIVFSQWTSMLSLLEEVLDAEGIGYVRLDGTMTTAAQDDAIARFNNDDDVSVFLISLKAGGVGLNLTRASRVFLMDIWWNPAIETQAMDRVHRVGQTREVFVYRLLMKDSVEERIESLQERKNMLAQGALADNKGKRASPQPAKLSFSMLKDLFKAI